MSAPPKFTTLLTFAQVADLLHETGPNRVQRMRRRLLNDPNAERFLVRIRTRGAGQRANYRVASAPLFEYYPQLRDHHEDTINAARRAVTEALSEVTDRIDGIVEDVEALGAETGKRLREVGERVGVVARRVDELERRGQSRLGF